MKVKLLVGSAKSRSHRLRHDRGRARRSADRPPARQRRRSTRRRSSAARSRRCRSSTRRSGRRKGTGDLFVNATYFVTGGGSRRTTTFTLDGANNDEGWGRQTMIATVPLGAIQEITVLSNAFSSEFGWTSGPALNIVTKSGTNDAARRRAVHEPSRRLAGEDVLDQRLLPAVGRRAASRPTTLAAINPVDIPDELNQVSGSIGGPIVKDKTFFFATADYTRQDRTTFLSQHAAGVRAAAGRQPRLHRQLPPDALQRPRRPQAHADPDADVPRQRRSVLRQQSAGRRRRHERAERRAQVLARARGPPRPITRRCSARTSSTRRASPTSTAIRSRCGRRRRSRPPTRAPARCRSPIGQSRLSDLFSHQAQFSDTLSWSRGKHYLRARRQRRRITPPAAPAASPAPPSLGTFTFLNTTTAPFDQLTLADVQNYTQPINFGISSYELKQWLYAVFVQDSIHVRSDLTLDLGLRYDRQTLTDANEELRAARRLRLASERRFAARRFAAATACTTRRSDRNVGRRLPGERARRIDDLHRDSRAVRFPDLPDGPVPAAVVRSEDAAAVAAAGARHHDQARAGATSTRRSSRSTG